MFSPLVNSGVRLRIPGFEACATLKETLILASQFAC